MNPGKTPPPSLFWLGLWLLSASWLFGLDYLFKAAPAVWVALVALGTILFCLSQLGAREAHEPCGVRPKVRPNFQWSAAFALLFVPGVFVLAWPDRLAPVLLLCGTLLGISPRAGRWLRAASAGVTLSGTILLAQSLALAAYTHFTARSHELPWPLPQMLAGIIRLLGVNAAADGSDLALSTMRENHRLGATWEFLLDPATLCFVAGGLVAVFLASRGGREETLVEANRPQTTAQAEQSPTPGAAKPGKGSRRLEPAPPVQRKWPEFSPGAKAAGWLLLATILWLPLRAGLHVGLFLHRALRTEYEAPLNLMNQLWSPWPQLLLLLPLALLVARWMPPFSGPAFGSSLSDVPLPRRVLLRAAGLSFATAAVLALAVQWDPVGQRKAGRIAVDEFHSKWEPTDRPMDTEWYGHLSGYNYACLYDFCSRYYEMSRLTNSLTDASLANLDVLVVKVPTERFQPAEIDAVVRFVERGGGLLLIGEHTDVFNTGYHLNSLARRFGFTFRYDCLFGMESFFDQFYEAPLVRHPVLQNLRAFDFATSCSIDPGRGSGRGVIVSTGLKNSMADYHANNYYPQAVDLATMRAGAFVQLWATRHGRGRVLAFTDSTIFSNFSTFEPGKIELFLGMTEWLNRQDRFGNPRSWMLVLGVALLVWTLVLAIKQPIVRRLVLAAGVLGWSVTCLALVAYQREALPEPKPVRPLTWVTIDRTLCDGALSKGGFIAGKADGFGIFERWILRLGCFLKRRNGLDALQGDLVVFLYPTKPVSADYRAALTRYVERGGQVLVVDSPTNQLSTAAALLASFGLSQKPLPGQGGTVSGPAGWPAVPVDGAHEITGGRVLFRLNDKPVGAVARHGQGAVVAIGFGSRFSDAQMGVTGDVVPEENLRKVFDLQFALLRAILRKQIEALALP